MAYFSSNKSNAMLTYKMQEMGSKYFASNQLEKPTDKNPIENQHSYQFLLKSNKEFNELAWLAKSQNTWPCLLAVYL